MYITNFVKVLPSKDVIEAYRITSKVNLGVLVRVINKYAEGLIASILSEDYSELRAGVYVAGIGDYRHFEEDVRTKIKDVLEKYQGEQAAQGLPVDESLNINNIEFQASSISSTSYVAANLLNNFLSKVIPEELQCPRRPDERSAICLDIDFLERKLWSKNVVDKDERFMGFCNDYPSLCRDKGSSCSKFFKVVKCIIMRFQHVVSDQEEIYLVLHHYYRRLSNLDLKMVIDYIRSNQIDLNDLLGVYVNYKTSKDSTQVCKIASINNNELKLECEGRDIRIDIGELDNLSINPTYSQSREFINKYLCKEFDKHKDLNKLYPSKYFSILENDLGIVKRIIGEPCIGRVRFSIGKELKRLR